MRLFCVRHGESVHNVAQVLAGVTDSALTNHGVLQTQRLGQHLVKSGVRFTRIYSSDLQRARITAEAIAHSQNQDPANPVDGCPSLAISPIQLPILREQDFGFYEGKSWTLRLPDSLTAEDPRHDPSFRDKETPESVAVRAEMFLDGHLLPLLLAERHRGEEEVVAVVSHGVTLSSLWRCLLLRFSPQSVNLGPQIAYAAGLRPLEYLPGWSNTGYLELDIKRLLQDPVLESIPMPAIEDGTTGPLTNTTAAPDKMAPSTIPGLLHGWGMVVKTINGKDHLSNLRRTGGGVGSAKHDERQRRIEGFFKKEPTT